MYRAAVISVFKATDDQDSFESQPYDIVFRQAFHDLGLAMSFSFNKSYAAPLSECELEILNISREIINAFTFDPTTYTRRPLVQIRAGYSPLQITAKEQIGELKNTLPIVYSGFPWYLNDAKVVGGRSLRISLSDVSTTFLQGENARIAEWFRKGQRLTEVLEVLLSSIAGLRFDLNALKDDPILSTRSIPNDIFYNNIHILGAIIPTMAREYGFRFSTDATGVYIFVPAQARPKTGALTIVSAETGMINHPGSVNWTHWGVQTLFGLPKVFFPGEWMTIDAQFIERSGVASTGKLDGVVIDAAYDWSDDSASISYVIAPEGEPVSSAPVITV